MSLIPGEPPLVHAPSGARRQLVPWLNLVDLDLLAAAEFGLETSLAASALYDAQRSARLRQWVRQDLGLGWALHPQLHLLQVEERFVLTRREQDRRRLEDQRQFLAAPFQGFLPINARISRGHAAEVGPAFLDLARAALGTALIAPAFAHLDRSPTTLTNNLALLEASIDYFHQEALHSVADDRGPFAKSRQLFAAIAVHARLLSDERFMRRLLQAYGEYNSDVYGFWVQPIGLSSGVSARPIRGLSNFIYPLQDDYESNVILDRAGGFGNGYLANGIAGHCMGTGAPEFISFPPSGFRSELRPGEQPSGFSLVCYNHVLLRNRQFTGRARGRSLLAYQRFPCTECGHHDPEKPPLDNKTKKLHGFYWHRLQARELSAGDVAVTRRTFLHLLRRAEQANALLGGDASYYAALRATLPPGVEALSASPT